MFSFGLQIHLMGFFRGRVIPEPVGLAPESNTRAPFVLEKDHTHEPRFVSTGGFSQILNITAAINTPKIFKAVIRFIPVYMVNLFSRPYPMYIKPHQTMCPVDAFLITNGYIPGRSKATRNVSYFDGFTRANHPYKLAQFWRVCEDLTQFFSCDFGVRHVTLGWFSNVTTNITKTKRGYL